MKCPTCHHPQMSETVEDHLYEISGLPNVVLKDTTVYRCPSCDEEMPAIRNLSGLHQKIAELLANKSDRTPEEELFLTKYREGHPGF